MVLTIGTKNIIDDVGAHFLLELKSDDPIPPKGILLQSLREACARLRPVFGRFLEPDYEDAASDDLGTPESYITFSLRFSPRREAGKAQAMADIIHSYLVNSVLTKCYSEMSLMELAAKHETQSVSDAQALSLMVNTKIPPR